MWRAQQPLDSAEWFDGIAYLIHYSSQNVKLTFTFLSYIITPPLHNVLPFTSSQTAYSFQRYCQLTTMRLRGKFVTSSNTIFHSKWSNCWIPWRHMTSWELHGCSRLYEKKFEYVGLQFDKKESPSTIYYYITHLWGNGNEFTSLDPIVFGVVTVFIFLVAWIIFTIYDINVEWWQKVAAQLGGKSGVIISSLFPATIH